MAGRAATHKNFEHLAGVYPELHKLFVAFSAHSITELNDPRRHRITGLAAAEVSDSEFRVTFAGRKFRFLFTVDLESPNSFIGRVICVLDEWTEDEVIVSSFTFDTAGATSERETEQGQVLQMIIASDARLLCMMLIHKGLSIPSYDE